MVSHITPVTSWNQGKAGVLGVQSLPQVVVGSNETLNEAELKSLPETEEDFPKSQKSLPETEEEFPKSQSLQGFPAQPKPKAIPTHHQRSLVQEGVESALLCYWPPLKPWLGIRELSQGIFSFRTGSDWSSSSNHSNQSPASLKAQVWLGCGSK